MATSLSSSTNATDAYEQDIPIVITNSLVPLLPVHDSAALLNDKLGSLQAKLKQLELSFATYIEDDENAIWDTIKDRLTLISELRRKLPKAS